MTVHLLQTASWVLIVFGLSVVACCFWLLCDRLVDRVIAWWKPAPPPVDLNVRLMTRAEYEEFLDLMSAAQESQDKRLRLAVSNSSPRVH